MIVVADASPLNYLIQLKCDDVLKVLYGRVLVPESVIAELRHPDAPAAVATWAAATPSWVDVRDVVPTVDPMLLNLDPGERAAIQLAEDQRADLLLIDERKGRSVASQRGISTTGTLGVLLAAGRKGLVDAEAAYRTLVATTTFRTAPGLEQAFLRVCREFRKNP